jgi:AcrR family transcriptional regulator
VPSVKLTEGDDAVSEKLLAVATEICARAGFEALRMRDVADKAGVALGTPSYKFKNRRGLLHAALKRAHRMTSDNLKEYYDKGLTLSAYEAALHFIWRRVQFAWDHPYETLLITHAVYSNSGQNFRKLMSHYADKNVERVLHIVQRLEDARIITLRDYRHKVFFARSYMHIGFSYTQSTALSMIDKDEITYNDTRFSVACSFESLIKGSGNPALLEQEVKAKCSDFLNEEKR